MQTRRKLALMFVLTILASAWSVSPVAAAPMEIQNDRSDNTMYFQYDGVNGHIASAYSSRIFNRGDRVDFLAYVAERRNPPQDRRLAGRIVLRLNRDRAVRYHGRFSLVVQDVTGVVVFRGLRDVNFVLRPQKGERYRVFRWGFDLPSGDYTVFARFRRP